MSGINYCFNGKTHGGWIYHKYSEARKGPECGKRFEDVVRMSATPQNRRPCRNCFSPTKKKD